MEARNILDGPLIFNEVCSWVKKTKRDIFLFKLDFDKELYLINWEFLDSVLMKMGFRPKWRLWIWGCLSSSRSSVIINCSSTDKFYIKRGVRHEDPLSHFLLIIAMEGLNVAMKYACEKEIFQGVNITNDGPRLLHLLYADDACNFPNSRLNIYFLK